MSVLKISTKIFRKCKEAWRVITVAAVVAVSPCCSVVVAASRQSAKDTKQFTLIIDAGHGGHDFGAVDNGQKEKEINLAVAKRLGSLVEDKLKDVKVVLTRSDDRFLTLQQRADVANKEKGDLFISIHTNSVDKNSKNRTTVSGASVYALGLHKEDNNMAVARRENSVIELESDYKQKYSGFDPSKDESYIIFEMAQKKNLHQSIRFAREAQQKLASVAHRKDRGVHQAGFWVLWATSMPAVLVELDFICNPTQAEYLGSSKGREQLAEALFEAVKNYVTDQKVAKNNFLEKHRDKSSENEDIRPAVAEGSTVMLAKAKEESKTASPAKADNPRRAEYAQRRRRSAASRQKSEARDLTTDHIPLHSSSERLAKPVEVASAEVTPEPELSKAEKKRLEKARKKAEKEAEKARKKQSKAKKAGKIENVYKIQILASADLLKQGNPRFRGLAPISVFRENNLYKYTYGEAKTKDELEGLLKQVRTKIPDAFIIRSTHLK